MDDNLTRIIGKFRKPGIIVLAMDADTKKWKESLRKYGMAGTDQEELDTRRLIIHTPGIEQFVGAFILHPSTLYLREKNGIPLVQTLYDRGIEVIVKADEGRVPLKGSEPETIICGIDTLAGRLAEYRQLGAKIAKMRSDILVGDGFPSDMALRKNTKAQAEFSYVIKEEGLIPMPEPDISNLGNHTIERSAEVTLRALSMLYEEMARRNIDLSRTLLKTSMVMPGLDYGGRITNRTIAQATIETYTRAVPKEVPIIFVLSGGMPDEIALERLNAVAYRGRDIGRQISSSFSRAFLDTPLSFYARSGDVQGFHNLLLMKAQELSNASKGMLYTS